MAARAAHPMDDVDRLRASNPIRARRGARSCAPRPRAPTAPKPPPQSRRRGSAPRQPRAAASGRKPRVGPALESDLAAARKALDVLAAERDALRPPETPLERFYDARTAAAVVSPSLRRPKLVASATETLLDLPSARRPRLADSASVAPSADDRAVEVALLRANLQALRLEAEQFGAGRDEKAPPAAAGTTCDCPAAAGRTCDSPAAGRTGARRCARHHLTRRARCGPSSSWGATTSSSSSGATSCRTSRRAMLRVGRRLALDADGLPLRGAKQRERRHFAEARAWYAWLTTPARITSA